MKGWRIFRHSVQLVLDNLYPALRVSLVLYLLQSAWQVYAIRFAPEPNNQLLIDPSEAVSVLFLGLAGLLASLWIAVAWHRFVLTGELPSGWLPKWHGGLLLAYLGRSLMLGLVIAGILFSAILVMSQVPALQGVMMPTLVLAASYFFFRLGVLLPAGTVGRKMSLGESWRATRDKDGALIVLALIMAAVALLIQVPSLVSGTPNSPISVLYSIVTGWFVMMIGVTVLTTLYGHYVEGRALD